MYCVWSKQVIFVSALGLVLSLPAKNSYSLIEISLVIYASCVCVSLYSLVSLLCRLLRVAANNHWASTPGSWKVENFDLPSFSHMLGYLWREVHMWSVSAPNPLVSIVTTFLDFGQIHPKFYRKYAKFIDRYFSHIAFLAQSGTQLLLGLPQPILLKYWVFSQLSQ